MRFLANQIIYSPTDLANHISCGHLTQLNKLAAFGELEKPHTYSRVLEMLRQKGISFEDQFLEQLKAEGKSIVIISRESKIAHKEVIEAMALGVDVIYQAKLTEEDEWEGWADFLIKAEGSSIFGEWCYEVMDTKLASDTRAGTILQIGLYSEAIAKIQGVSPKYMHVKTPESHQRYLVSDFSAYIRLIKRKLIQAVREGENTYPDPVPHCDICNWWERCNTQRRSDDHLAFVAGLGGSQTKELRVQGINTLENLANVSLPVPFTPSRGAKETYNKLREQARVQFQSRVDNKLIYEFLELVPDTGFFKLPEPSPNDIYLDLEGDPMVEPSGIEYLVGWVHQGQYYHIWAENSKKEMEAFESFMDFVITLKSQDPSCHIYHYAPYEPVAFKRLMGKYATREDEMDYLLRSGTFIDLYGVVRQSIRASVEKYSIKDLEPFYGYHRKIDLRELSSLKADYEYLLEIGMAQEATDIMRNAIQVYNEDDCRSTQILHEWLESLRLSLSEEGINIPRPELVSGEAGEGVTAHQERIRPIMESLLIGIPFDQEDRNQKQQANFILAHMLDWYRREKKSFWWEYFRLIDLPDHELLEERGALAYLDFTGERESVKKSVIDTYHFPSQEFDIRVGMSLKTQDEGTLGTVESIDPQNRLIRIKKGPSKADYHPISVFSIDNIRLSDKEVAIIELAEWVLENGITSEEQQFSAGRQLLLRTSPRVIETPVWSEDNVEYAHEWAKKLNHSVLPIQGPPGTGKSHTAGHVIVGLLKEGKKVGITALSHKVITNLMIKVKEVAEKTGFELQMIQKSSKGNQTEWLPWTTTENKAEILSKMDKVHVIGGTSFLWCLPDFRDSVDYLFVDEAGQLSLIDTLAISGACKNMVLLGDPQQLQQPQKGVHPQGTEVSALGHLLNGNQTILNEQGIFLDKTWRMHPDINALVSEMFYEGKLLSVEGLENQRIEGETTINGSGLRYLEVNHEGNTNSSAEEVSKIVLLVNELLGSKVQSVDKEGKGKILTESDIRIITPYNAQVELLKEALPNIDIGTVDKFQGQQAEIIIYSLATSDPQDAPRGMDFLYSPNRFNVAISRAKALFIMIASPMIFEPECKSPVQIKLANPFCRFRECAGEI
ncbi:TM0106 family RecB-like putative nuclease [Cyclobacteriaceae bacterium YHN15]|nr:TM0106 family RecB-like putative nuclease [Cyclobacteriaceae bacterium YHN15]